MKKTLLTLLISAMLLPACGGSDDPSGVSESDELFYFSYQTSEFEVDVPEEWEVINSFTSDYPDNIRIAFRDNIKDGDFVANVTVFKEDNQKSQLNADLAQKYLNDHADTLINYKLISQEEVKLSLLEASSQSIINTYEGKNETDSNMITYMQTYLAEGNIAWIVTASYYAPTEDEFTIERMDTMLKSFTVK